MALLDKIKEILVLSLLECRQPGWENLTDEEQKLFETEAGYQEVIDFIQTKKNSSDVPLHELVSISNNSRVTQDVLIDINTTFSRKQKDTFRWWLQLVKQNKR